MVIFTAIEQYCLWLQYQMTESREYEPLARSCDMTVEWPGVKLDLDCKSDHYTTMETVK